MIAPGSQAPAIAGSAPWPALVAFYTADCGASAVAVPRLARVAEACPGLRVIAVSQDPTAAFVDDAPGVESVIDAPGYESSRAYGIVGVPTLVVIDAGGTVLDVEIGWNRERFNEIARTAGALVGAEPREAVPAGDGPDFRPG